MHGIWLVAFVLQWILLLLLAVLFAGVLRFLASFQEKIQLAAPPVSRFELGERVGAFELPDLVSRTISSQDVLQRYPQSLLLLLTPTCTSCRMVLSQVAELASRDGGLGRLNSQFVCIIAGKHIDVESVVQQHPVLLSDRITILVDEQARVLGQYLIPSVPTGLVVDQTGRVLDQSMNPHANWVYKVLDVPPPAQSNSSPIPLITPAIQMHR